VYRPSGDEQEGGEPDSSEGVHATRRFIVVPLNAAEAVKELITVWTKKAMPQS